MLTVRNAYNSINDYSAFIHKHTIRFYSVDVIFISFYRAYYII